MNNWLITEDTKLYIIADTKILKSKPILSEKAEEFVTAITKTKEDEDLLWFSGRYCTADARNGNGDGFKLDDLEKMYEYAIFKPVSWLHNEDEKVGFIVDSQLKEEGDEVYVEITGVIWCSTPHDAVYAEKMIDYFDKNRLGLSMETMGEKVKCSKCEKEFPIQSGDMDNPYGHYCEHLKSRKMSDVTRWILEPQFSGVGIIPSRGRHKPADKDAWVREVASLNEDDDNGEEDINMGDDTKYTKAQMDELVSAREDSVRKEYASLESDLDSVKNEKAEADKSTADLQTKLDEKEGELSQANDDLDTVNKENESLKAKIAEYEQEKADAEQAKFESRVKEIKDSGVELTDEIADKLKAEILDDEKFDGVKAMFAKKDVKPAKAKVTLETDDDLQPTESDEAILREAFSPKED